MRNPFAFAGASWIENWVCCPARTVAEATEALKVKSSKVNVWVADAPPPGAGFVTSTGRPAAVDAVSAAGTTTVSSVELTKVVGSVLPANVATDAGMKPVPFSVSGLIDAPAAACVGVMEVSVGAGFATLNVSEFEVPPPGAGLVTVTANDPLEIVMVETCTAGCVGLITVVGCEAPPKLTNEVEMKFVPLIVSVKAADPGATLAGSSDAIVGTGLLAPAGVVSRMA